MPRVSIGMPVRNGERFLRQSLDSILAQTFEDFELVISDNASCDRTRDICCEYANKDGRIRYVRNEANLGASENYNRVFQLSSGQYFRWAAGDDLFAPTSLERCVAVLERNNEVVLCYPQTTLVDENGEAIKDYKDGLDLRSAYVCERFRQALKVGMVNAIYGLMRSDVLKKTALIGRYPGADGDLVIELCLYGRFFEIPFSLFFRRMHGDAYSSIKTVQGRQEFHDPKTRGHIYLEHWTRTFQRFVAISRAPLKVSTKLRLIDILGRQAVTGRKQFVKELWLGLQETMRRRRLVNQRIEMK